MNKVNPESVILEQLDGKWMQMCLFLLWKLSPNTPVEITLEDMKALQLKYFPLGPVILTHGHKSSIELSIVTADRAKELAQLERDKVQAAKDNLQ